MAKLTSAAPGAASHGSDCCDAERQAECCDVADKTSCCEAGSSTCGCQGDDTEEERIRAAVRARYAAAARCVGAANIASCCGDTVLIDENASIFGAGLYDEASRNRLPDTVTMASLGCGNPTAVAELRSGEVVLDLGSGGGIDVLLSAVRVGPTGKAYGLDMTDEMLTLARENQRKSGLQNVEWLRGEIEAIPLPSESVGVVISNCAINLSGDKPRVLAEAGRVLKPGGRLAISDVIADEDMSEAIRADLAQWTGCIAGAMTKREFTQALEEAGLERVEIAETHRVHDKAGSAIVRARKPRRTRTIPFLRARLPQPTAEGRWRARKKRPL